MRESFNNLELFIFCLELRLHGLNLVHRQYCILYTVYMKRQLFRFILYEPYSIYNDGNMDTDEHISWQYILEKSSAITGEGQADPGQLAGEIRLEKTLILLYSDS